MSMTFVNCTGETFTPTKSGALSTWIWEVCRAAAREGCEPLIISRSHPESYKDWDRLILLDYPWMPPVRGTGIGRLLCIQRDIEGWGHLRQGAYARRVARAIRNAGVSKQPMFLQNDPELAVFLRWQFPDAFIVHLFQNTNHCHEKFRREFARSVNVAAAVSDYCARWNEKYFGYEEGVVVTLYSGVDIERFSPATTMPPGPPLLNFVGRTDESKAPDLLLGAAKVLSASTKNFGLQILGSRFYGWSEPDAYQRKVRRLAEELERDGITVRWPGFVNRYDLPGELRKAQINVVPSRWDEPFGLVTLEGMASGLATVASNTGGTPEVVGDAGLLFGRDCVNELAEHLRRLLSDAQLRAEYGRKARARAETFSWSGVWQQVRCLTGV